VKLHAVLLATALLAVPLGAQKIAPPPLRPQLDAGADTNDAHAYYLYGMRMIEAKPAESVRAFYWASRIDPASGEFLYDVYVARLVTMSSSDLVAYFDHTAKKRSPQNIALDSLMYRAYMMNPFLYRNLERSLEKRLIEAEIMDNDPSVDRAELAYDIAGYMNSQRAAAWQAYATGRFPDALNAYARALHDRSKNKKDHEEDDSELHAERARIFYLLGNMDSARTEMTAAIDGMRAHDAKHMVFLYESKAMYEQSLGMIHERAKNPSAARDAYGQALTEDLSHYAAHSQLAQLQLAAGDTAAAIAEMDLAVQLKPDDPVLHYVYAFVLVNASRDADASNQLMLAAAADSSYAAPHLLLARIADVEQYADEALAEYRRFLALDFRADPQYAFAQERIAKLSAPVVVAAPKQ
jgi:hypothetical protein